MNRTRIPIWIMFAAILSATAYASDIYRYVDADGNVYYMDRPTGAETEERVAIRTTRNRSAAAQSTASAAEQSDSASTPPETVPAADSTVADKKPTRAERKAAQREREEKCQSYRDRLETLETSRRLYREDENGERVFLDESESQAAREKVANMIREDCS